MRTSLLTAFALLVAGTASASAQDPTVNFVTEILPILESRCIECHQAPRRLENGRMKRPKGRVRLDSMEAIRASKRGELIVPGKPDASIVLDVISLAADHDDIMPPTSKGPPLSNTEIDNIRQWIRQGASFGNWTSAQETSANASGAAAVSQPNKVLPPITALAFTPDGKSVVAASQRGLQVLAWPGLTAAKTIEIQTPNLHDLTFSRSGDRIAIGGGDPSETGLVEVLSWPTGEAVRQVGDHDDSVFASAFAARQNCCRRAWTSASCFGICRLAVRYATSKVTRAASLRCAGCQTVRRSSAAASTILCGSGMLTRAH